MFLMKLISLLHISFNVEFGIKFKSFFILFIFAKKIALSPSRLAVKE
jgi:hypothetical protein